MLLTNWKVNSITINPDGTVEFLGDTCPVDLPLSNPIKRRVSTIQPLNAWKRRAFLFLRYVCSDRGRVAAYTRTWSGPWTAVILATGQTYTAQSRADCIAWEIEQLQ
jgi:hypothetical protein